MTDEHRPGPTPQHQRAEDGLCFICRYPWPCQYAKPTPPPPTAQGLDMQMRDLHRRRHALHSACAPYGCVVRYREGVLQQIVEAEENEPKPEAKAALARLRKTIAAMPTREDGV